MRLDTSPETSWLTRHWPGLVILLTFFIIGTLYVFYTPLWQSPDEPAHYNYIRSLATGEGFPVLEVGDYDQEYLAQLTSRRFPPELPIDSVRYEGHQPPLYYLLATPVYWISGGSVMAIRMFSLALGSVGIGLIMLILLEYKPAHPGIAWLGGGLVALIPQFVAMMSAINNDALTMALLWLWLWLALRYLRGQTSPLVLGGILGALLVTKTTGYGALILAVLVVYLRDRRAGQPFGQTARELLSILIPGLLIGGMWWTRNLVVYGWPDVMGLIRHDVVVVGQPRAADWIAQQGLLPFLWGAGRTTFRSFWGQFGWMGVVLDARIYQGLAIFSGLVLWGAAWRLREALRQAMKPRQRDLLILLGTSAGISLSMFLVYNLTFVQHQGRYLFPALPIIALTGALGLQRLVERKLAVGTALVMLVGSLIAGGVGLLLSALPMWPLALMGAAIALLFAAAFVPQRWHSVVGAGLLFAMAALNVWCLFGFIVPLLT